MMPRQGHGLNRSLVSIRAIGYSAKIINVIVEQRSTQELSYAVLTKASKLISENKKAVVLETTASLFERVILLIDETALDRNFN